MKRTEIERLLPGVFQRGATEASPLGAVLDAMEILHEPDEAILRDLAEVFDPRRADARSLTMLAHWVDLERVYPSVRGASAGPDWTPRRPPMPSAHLRELIAEASSLSKWRGSEHALRRFLEIATGHAPFRVEERLTDAAGEVIPFHVRVVAPKAAVGARELIERIVELEKPAYVTWELSFE